ncbi:MAG TPA: response regulator [Pyrinomonadaceae bacterium]|nr:response regulator [Pyrinomonadaceae bacterium]
MPPISCQQILIFGRGFVVENKAITVLLVEDNPGDAIIIGALLRTKEELFRVTHVSTLASALERLRTHEVDVILLDLRLADSTGLETLTRIRAEVPTTPIIIISGATDKEIAVRALLQGAQNFLPKEFLDEHQLIRAIERVIAATMN